MSEPAFSWKSVIFESLFVVLGVVLAFLGNEYRSNVQEEQKAKKALKSIVFEVENNKNAIESSLKYHEYLRDTLYTFMRNNPSENSIPQIKVFERGFISPAELLSTAYQTALATDVLNNYRYELVLEIGNLYAKQQSYDLQKSRVGDIIYKALYADGTGKMLKNYRNLLSVILTFTYKERELIKAYDITLKDLEEYRTIE